MDKRILKSSFIKDDNVCAFFTTRDLPLKHGERIDLTEDVENNKKLVCKGFGIPLENLVIPFQTHSDNIYIVNRSPNKQLNNTDALITDQPNIALALNFADCVPIILYDPIKKVIAVVHAGWRGTASKIAQKTVQKMVESFKVNPQDIIALIGPCIAKCCFEVKADVAEQIFASIPHQDHAVGQVCPTDEPIQQGQNGNPALLSPPSTSHPSVKVDLKEINKLQLLASGVLKIDLCEYCTCCDSELFFSYRRENGKTARHSAVIILSEK